jgi:lipoprotein-releasing system permease protein
LSLSFHIAKRYFFSRKTGGGFNLISLISGISLLGYIVGAAALIIVLSVFNGFEVLFTSMYSNFDSDLKITSSIGKTINENEFNYAALSNNKKIISYSRVVEENILLRYNNQQTIATLKGVDENYINVTQFDSNIVAGYVDMKLDSVYAIVGQGIAYRLSVDPDNIFKVLSIYVPKRNASSFLRPDDAFNKAVIVPSGVFSVQEEVDNKFVVTPLHFAHELLEMNDEISAIEIKLQSRADMSKVKKELQAQLGSDYVIKNRFEQHESFFKVMRSEKAISYIILLFILLIAASNTISSLYILVMEKKRDLHIFKSMGITAKQASHIFIWQGLIIAVVGGGLGIMLGLALCYLQLEYGLVSLQGAAYSFFSSYPVEVRYTDVILVAITVLILGGLTTLYPARKAKEIINTY